MDGDCINKSTTLPLKTCTKCGDPGEFSRNSTTKDGLQSQCKTCATAYRAEHAEEYVAYHAAYRAKHRDEKAASDAAYRSKHREEAAARQAAYNAAHREEKAAYCAAYYTEHREEMVAYNAAYNAEHREERAAYIKAYRATHREEIAAYLATHREERASHNRNRRSRKRNAPGTHTAADVRAQYGRQRGRCYWCEKRVGDAYHVDHVIPLFLGGSDGPENLVVSCPPCNDRKGAKHPMDFAGVLC